MKKGSGRGTASDTLGVRQGDRNVEEHTLIAKRKPMGRRERALCSLRMSRTSAALLALTITLSSVPAAKAAHDGAHGKDQIDAQEIIQRSIQAMERDFSAAPQFDCSERDQNESGSKTFRDLIIDGSDYQQLIALNGKPLPLQREAEEARKLQQEVAKRRNESPQERARRIARYQAARKRNHALMAELAKAFTFALAGEDQLASRHVYVLRATPRPGYRSFNRDTEVLTGMKGKLWIDMQSFQWVRVEAEVTHPVGIEGILARVEPGTRFEPEKMPVAPGIWLAKHFSMSSRSRVFLLFPHQKHEEESFFDYRRAEWSANAIQPPER